MRRSPNLDDYDQQRATFQLDVPARFNPVVDILERWAEESPDDAALVSADARGEVYAEHTVAELVEDSRRAAVAFQRLGIEAGERVFVMLPRMPEWYSAMLGAIRIGAVPMPGTCQLTSRDISYRITAADAVAAVVDEAGAAKLADHRSLPSLRQKLVVGGDGGDGWQSFASLIDAAGSSELPESTSSSSDPMLLFFTSGTVSFPKMVLHPMSYGLGHVTTARFWHDLHAGDRHWTVSDTGWAKAAWGGLFGQWHERATVVQVALGKPDPEMILTTIRRNGITSFCAPPTLYRLLIQADLKAFDLGCLRHCTSAGEPLNPEVIRAWKAGTGLTIYDGYGQSETTLLVGNFPAVPVRAGSMGKPTPGWDVQVLDNDDQPAPEDTVGSIAVRTDPRPVGLFDEYFRDPEANAAAFRNGWYFTGDKAWRDGDGYLWFEGRSDDVITSAAYRIGPFEVESALMEHPAVVECAVVGKPDAERTQIVTAFVVLVAGRPPSEGLAVELQEHAKSLTAPYKYPREIHFVEDLPKTVSGKIRRSALRERLATEGATGNQD